MPTTSDTLTDIQTQNDSIEANIIQLQELQDDLQSQLVFLGYILKMYNSIDEGKKKIHSIENNNRNLIPANPSVKNQIFIEQRGGAGSEQQKNIRDFFMNFYKEINILYRHFIFFFINYIFFK